MPPGRSWLSVQSLSISMWWRTPERKELGVPKAMTPNQQEFDRMSAQSRSVLGEEVWQAKWAEGAKLSPDQALALVTPSLPV